MTCTCKKDAVLLELTSFFHSYTSSWLLNSEIPNLVKSFDFYTTRNFFDIQMKIILHYGNNLGPFSFSTCFNFLPASPLTCRRSSSFDCHLAFSAARSQATCGTTIADMYDTARVAYGICIWGSFGVCGPVFGPLIGRFVGPAKGFRWTIWTLT